MRVPWIAESDRWVDDPLLAAGSKTLPLSSAVVNDRRIVTVSNLGRIYRAKFGKARSDHYNA